MDPIGALLSMFSGPPRKAWGSDMVKLTTTNEEIEVLFGRTSLSTTRTYRLPSVAEVLGFPAITRAVSLISGTTGMLSVQGYRNGDLMADPPKLIVRPDPYETPEAFYSTTSAQKAKYGEFVWYIASRDGDNYPSALINVPLLELAVEANPDNRLLPKYRWGTITGTRYSPANPSGKFVHVKDPLGEPFDLRGKGPLQRCKAATSVTVESQAWAAQFYADGGNPSLLIKKAGTLSGAEDVNGYTEAERLRNQWIDQPHNVPRVVDDTIDDVKYMAPNSAAGNMLDARQYQNGDAARMFGIPGSLLEYQQPGASLTYQNLEGEFTKFVRTCLQPTYLEPIEQAISDLLPRTTAARFNVDGFLRADIKTRYEVHKLAIDSQIYDPAYAQKVEGITAGNVEYAPIPASPPAAVPRAIPRAASLDVRCQSCGKLVARALGPGSELDCPRCKMLVVA